MSHIGRFTLEGLSKQEGVALGLDEWVHVETGYLPGRTNGDGEWYRFERELDGAELTVIMRDGGNRFEIDLAHTTKWPPASLTPDPDGDRNVHDEGEHRVVTGLVTLKESQPWHLTKAPEEDGLVHYEDASGAWTYDPSTGEVDIVAMRSTAPYRANHYAHRIRTKLDRGETLTDDEEREMRKSDVQSALATRFPPGSTLPGSLSSD